MKITQIWTLIASREEILHYIVKTIGLFARNFCVLIQK